MWKYAACLLFSAIYIKLNICWLCVAFIWVFQFSVVVVVDFVSGFQFIYFSRSLSFSLLPSFSFSISVCVCVVYIIFVLASENFLLCKSHTYIRREKWNGENSATNTHIHWRKSSLTTNELITIWIQAILNLQNDVFVKQFLDPLETYQHITLQNDFFVFKEHFLYILKMILSFFKIVLHFPLFSGVVALQVL